MSAGGAVTQLVVATSNPGKQREIAGALAGLGIAVLNAAEAGVTETPEEVGTTYAHNALLKARAALAATGLPVLADDSGLEVDALEGAPGVHSARFGGRTLSDAERNRLLLERLDGIPPERRGARFRAVLALLIPGDVPRLFEGTVEGWIGFEPRGTGGFGYDPVFCLRDDRGRLQDRTLAQLSPGDKNRVSHRGRALVMVRRALETFSSRR